MAPGFIEEVNLLGRCVKQGWRKKGYSNRAFAEIAFRALRESGLHRRFTMEGFLRSLWDQKALPTQLTQLSMHNDFGEPAITLFYARRFLIDVYFWVLPEISIHNHGFQGAFTVLQGKSLHCQYNFKVKERIPQNDVRVGDLSLHSTLLLEKGNVEKIIPGSRFIHQVWHLSLPTVSLTIRTLQDPAYPPQEYLKPGLAFPTGDLKTLQRKQMDLLGMLHRSRQTLSTNLLKELMARTESHRTLHCLVQQFEKARKKNWLKEIQRNPSLPQKWAPLFLDSVAEAPENGLDWSVIKDEGERLLLALLCSGTRKDRIFELVKAYNPREAPEVSILGWLEGLIKKRSIGLHLNETGLQVLKLLILGNSKDRIAHELSKKYGVRNSPKFQKEIRDFCRRLRSDVLLKGLF